jgi:hypothetical protein
MNLIWIGLSIVHLLKGVLDTSESSSDVGHRRWQMTLGQNQ